MFRIISSFLKACDENVLKLTCGKTRVGAVEGGKHLQGLTIDLSQKPEPDSVSPACRKEMETIAEMQADDFHPDRALQLACNQVTYYLVSGALIVTIPRQDREQLCPRVQVGEGGVYR